MAVIVHRPAKAEREQCLIGAEDFFLYIGGPVLGAGDFQSEVIKYVAGSAPNDSTLHIANPRWTDIPREERLSTTGMRGREESHITAALRLGERGLILYYAAALDPCAAVPPANRHFYDHTNSAVFSSLAKTRQQNGAAAPVVLGIDTDHTVNGLYGYVAPATEHNVPIHDGLYQACGAAAAILFNQPPGEV